MKYYISKVVELDIESTTIKITEELQKKGFGIVTKFDVDKAFKEKLDINFRPYRILGACNPPYALETIKADDKIGTLLPCNVMLQTIGDKTEIAIINPRSMLEFVNNAKINEIAEEIAVKLEQVLESIK